MADSGDPAILVRDVVKDFGPRRVIEGLDFSVPRGQVCAMLGPNGAGKTTTIHMLLGLTLPTSGTIEILGHDIAADRSAALARTNFTASYVSLPWRMKVRELLRVFCHLYSVPDPDTAIEEVAALLGIEEQLDRLGQSLSTGQQTMVLLAKALVNRPDLLFLDEPTASLDPERAVVVRTILRRIADERRMTILITSHNMLEVERLADRILFVSKGRIAADATAAELRQRFGADDLEEVYLKVAAGALDVSEADVAGLEWGTVSVVSRDRVMSWSRVKGVLMQSIYVMKHSPLRIMEMIYWPFIEIILWGFITRYLQDTDAAVPGGVSILLGAVVFWDVCFRTQQELAMTQLMDMWDRSILNLYASPLRQREYVTGAILFSLRRVAFGTVLLSVFVGVAFDFNILDVGAVLVPSFVLLVMFGWGLGLMIHATVLRFGSNAEVLAWSLALLLQPVCAVFYPVSALPGWLQAIAKCVPASYVFEALRAFLADGEVLVGDLVIAGVLDVVYLVVGGLVLAAAYRSVRTRGLLSRPGY